MSTLLPGNIVYGGPVLNTETHSYRSLGHFILEKYKSYGDKVMMIDAVNGVEYTAKFIYDSIIRLANILTSMGVKSGDVVSISSENSVEFAIALFATFALNATAAPINVTYSEREVDHAINLSKPKVIFASSQTIDRINKVAKNNAFVKIVISFNSAQESKEANVYSYKNLMESKNITVNGNFDPPSCNRSEDVALIVCSSGTTGLPKGVQLTQNNILTTLDSYLETTFFGDVKMLTVLPWFHVFGCLSLVTCSCLANVLIYLSRFEERKFLGAIEKYRIVMALMVPPLMVFLAKHPLVEKYDLSSLLVLISGAAPLSKETEDQIKKRIGVPIIRQGYGLSEATLNLLIQNDDACKPGSVGALIKGVYAKVIDTETGRILGANQRGELCFKSDYIMKGYIGDFHATNSSIKDGWLHTGDIGYYDDDFEFFIVDRIKELIKYKAFQVPPAEIEAILLTHPKIKDAAVIGKPDEDAGELPMAFVVKQANVQLTEKEVADFVAENTSSPKRLRGGVLFVDDIPKNPSGKILRRILRDMIKNPKSKL